MYTFIKTTIKKVIPKESLFKNELLFRYFHGIFFKGTTYQCNICLKKLSAFISLKNKDLMCPFCGSLSRTRRLWSLLHENNSIKGSVLHFSPSRSLYRVLKKNKGINYFSTDFENEFLADYNFDITNIDQPNETFDLIICYHILEHIIDDNKAMSELYRVMKPNGTIYIQTPFKEGEIYEDFSIISPKKREEHFEQNDHVRIYSVKGLTGRLKNVGFRIKIELFKQNKNAFYYGFISPETLLILTK